MRTILIQAITDRGTETRISTRKSAMEIAVYYKGEDGLIRQIPVVIKPSGNMIRLMPDGQDCGWIVQGKLASQFDYK